MDRISYLIFFILGAVFGSFINVLVHRIPRGISVISPPSHCPYCKRKLKPWHNIPIISYVILKGRCYYCNGKIPLRYLLVELITSLLFVIIYVKTGINWKLVQSLMITVIIIAISFIDLEHMIIPDKLNIALSITGLIFSISGKGIVGIKESIIGGLIGLFIMLSIFMASGERMGFGDVKFLAAIGVNLGWKLTLTTFILSIIIGSIIGLTLMGLRIKGRKDPIPFGPFISLGAIISYLIGDELIRVYWQIFC